MPTFNDIARKAVGDFSDEFPEAGYRAIASNLANSFVTIVNEAAKKQQKGRGIAIRQSIYSDI
jgi:hypothetical protein